MKASSIEIHSPGPRGIYKGEVDATCVQFGSGGRIPPSRGEFPEIYGSYIIYKIYHMITYGQAQSSNCRKNTYHNATRPRILLYSVRRNKTPLNKYHYFRYSLIFFTKFPEIILDTTCHYCCKFYHLSFRCLEVAQL